MCQRMLSQSLFKSIYHREVFSADGEVYRFSSSFPDGNKQKARYVCLAAPSRQRAACRHAQGPSHAPQHACCVGHYQASTARHAVLCTAACAMPSCAVLTCPPTLQLQDPRQHHLHRTVQGDCQNRQDSSSALQKHPAVAERHLQQPRQPHHPNNSKARAAGQQPRWRQAAHKQQQRHRPDLPASVSARQAASCVLG